MEITWVRANKSISNMFANGRKTKAQPGLFDDLSHSFFFSFSSSFSISVFGFFSLSCKYLLKAKLDATQRAGLKSIFKLQATIFGGSRRVCRLNWLFIVHTKK